LWIKTPARTKPDKEMMMFARKIIEEPLIRRDVSLAVLFSGNFDSSTPGFESCVSFSFVGGELLISNLSK
jgi:hypothetical protein